MACSDAGDVDEMSGVYYDAMYLWLRGLELPGDGDSTVLKTVVAAAVVVAADDDDAAVGGDERDAFGGVEAGKVQVSEVLVLVEVNQLDQAVILIHLYLYVHLMSCLHRILHCRLDWVVKNLKL